jgi:hypothetical protein
VLSVYGSSEWDTYEKTGEGFTGFEVDVQASEYNRLLKQLRAT